MNHKSSNTKNMSYYLLAVLVFTGYLVFGFSENVRGPAIPRIQADFSLSEIQLGLLLAFNSLAYLLACSFTGLLTQRFGSRITNILVFGTMTFSGLLFFISVNYLTVSISYFVLYLGNGMLEFSIGFLTARIFTKNVGTMMNLSHFFYGLSSTIAPVAATAVMSHKFFGWIPGWRGMYLIMLSLSIIPLIQSLFVKFPEEKVKKAERLPFKDFVKDTVPWLLVIIITFGVISELSIGGWLVNFLEKVYKWDTASSSRMLSAFFLAFTLSRLFLGPLTDKFGFAKSLIVLSGFSGLCSITAVIAGQSGAFLFALAGLGIAPIYPTVMAVIAKRYQDNCDTAITFILTLMGIGNVVGNFLVGTIIDLVKEMFEKVKGAEAGLISGMQAGYVFIGACALVCSITSMILYKNLKKRKEIL